MAPAVDTYLDGELSPAQIVEVEGHLTQCASCREHVALDRAMRTTIRRVVPLRAPTSLRERMQATMAAERARHEQEQREAAARQPTGAAQSRCVNDSARVLPFRRQGEGVAPAPLRALTRPEAVQAVPAGQVVSLAQRRAHRTPAQMRVRYAVPFVVAAGVAFAVSMHRPAAETAAVPAAPSAPALQALVGLDGLVDDLVSLHAQPLPPEVTQPDEVRRFDPFVGVPVEPPKLQPFGAKWVGGRMLPLRDSRAAMLQYSLAGGHRISVYVYDPRRVRPESNTLRQRVVRDAPVFVGNIRGYNVAATERRGVGYAIATDLDEPESVELVAASAP